MALADDGPGLSELRGAEHVNKVETLERVN
jgi:hypothetical protein